MKGIDEEEKKLKSLYIRRQNPILKRISRIEENLIEEFNRDLVLILGEKYLSIIEIMSKSPNIKKVETRKIEIPVFDTNGNPILDENGKAKKQIYEVPKNLLQNFHKSYIEDENLRLYYEDCLKKWFTNKTEMIKASIKNLDSYHRIMKYREPAFALTSLAISAFHKRPNMILRKNQKRAGLAMSEGDVAELATGEGKTLSAVLPGFLFGLTGKGVHIVTANSYLSKRDYDELLPIYQGLGLSAGYLPKDVEELAQTRGIDYSSLSSLEKALLHRKLINIHHDAYMKDLTFGETNSFAFDYLHDNNIYNEQEMIQRYEWPIFVISDETDKILIDDGQTPFILSEELLVFKPGLSLKELCEMLRLPYKDCSKLFKDEIEDEENLTLEEANCISVRYRGFCLVEDPSEYQILAEEFFRGTQVFKAQNDSYNVKYAKDLYRTLTSSEEDGISKEDKEKIYEKNDILYCEELKQFTVVDHCYKDLLDYCFLNFRINSEQLQTLKDKIISDDNFQEGVDYNITDGNLRITPVGAKKINILEEIDDPKVIEDFYKNRLQATYTSASIIHYFNKAVEANLLLQKGVHYTISNGEIKVLNNGRIQEGSIFTDGIHQAVELKENISPDKRTKENKSTSSITQKAYFSRCGLLAGMTGTGGDLSMYRLNVRKIPRYYAEEYFDNPNDKKPTGAEKKKTQFTLTVEDKINLIVNSVNESLKTEPLAQPVMIVASNPDEIPLIGNALKNSGINFNVLEENSSKDREALIIASAGTPGYVLITTEMCGRGTDIKVGGDKTVFDYYCEKHIKQVEERYLNKFKTPMTSEMKAYYRNLVEKVKIENVVSNVKEDWESKLENIGLKVISSGIFPLERIDRQLEGRTGRNGMSGVFERFVCPDDLRRIGMDAVKRESLDKFLERESDLESKKATPGYIEALKEYGYSEINKENLEEVLKKYKKDYPGNILLDDKTYNIIMKAIHETQKRNELQKSRAIKDAQDLNKTAADLIETYRAQKRKIILSKQYREELIKKMITDTVDAIISSYVISDDVSEDSLIKPMHGEVKGEPFKEDSPIDVNGLCIDLEAVNLEMKQILGITFDSKAVYDNKMNALTFRDAAIRTALIRINQLQKEGLNPKSLLLKQNGLMLSKTNDILDRSFMTKYLTSITKGMESQADSLANVSFGTTRRKLTFESNKATLGIFIGKRLKPQEFLKLEEIKSDLYDLRVTPIKDDKDRVLEYDVEEPSKEPNNLSVIDKIRRISRRIEKENQEEYEEVGRQLENKRMKDEPIDLDELCSHLYIKPMTLMNAVVDGNEIKPLKVNRELIRHKSRSIERQLNLIEKDEAIAAMERERQIETAEGTLGYSPEIPKKEPKVSALQKIKSLIREKRNQGETVKEGFLRKSA